MQITVFNNRPTGGEKVSCVDGTTVSPGSSHTMVGRSKAEYTYQMTASLSDDNVKVLASLEASDRAPLVVAMNDIADPAADATTSAGEGFALQSEAGAAANAAPAMYLGAFDDADCTVPAVNATLDTASSGTIVSGAGTNQLKVTPTAAGAFACTLTDAEVEVVYLKAWPADASYVVDSSDTTSAEFTVS
jgi:hypothetical protein